MVLHVAVSVLRHGHEVEARSTRKKAFHYRHSDVGTFNGPLKYCFFAGYRLGFSIPDHPGRPQVNWLNWSRHHAACWTVLGSSWEAAVALYQEQLL